MATKQAATMASYVTPVLKDEEGRRLTRTMRTTDRLQELMCFYYAMVPSVEEGKGVFLHRGRRLDYKQTPADYQMKDGDEIQFLPEIEASMFVTPELYDFKGRTFTRTMRRTDTVQSLMDYYCAMVPTMPHDQTRFLFDGRRLTGDVTLADLDLEDGDVINVVHRLPLRLWASTPTY